MKVVPRRKNTILAPDEIRVINVDKAAVDELLLENLMECKCEYFGTRDCSDDHVYVMNWNPCEELLSYAVIPIKYCHSNYEIDFAYIRKTIGMTTDSLFKPNRYRSITITPEMLIPKG